MSEDPFPRGVLPPSNEPLRLAVRRFRWFSQAFHRFAETSGRQLGCGFTVDDDKLAAAFVRWIEAIETQKPADKSQRREFFEFAAALMLRELVCDMPLRADGPAAKARPDSAAAFWPEGYCCTTFCLAVHAAALEQEFHLAANVDPAFDDLRTWWSFRENATADSRVSAGFLQMMLGHSPNWAMPDVFRVRLQAQHADDSHGKTG